ncbi:MAG: putative ABC transporter permease [Oscillospiraceae bacterium]|jgi:uncharacterized membrane protein|nr:putative ABC transporter permease [Oscillospiraceae bacterium]
MDRFAASSRRTAALEEWLLLFFACSAAGWLWEVLLTAAAAGRWVNRGLLHGPWLPVYGVGGVLLSAALRGLRRRPAAALVLGALLGGAVEYGAALILEQWYHRRWWDYTGWTGSIRGRVCLASLTGFALAGWLASRWGEPLLRRFSRMSPGVRGLLCRGVGALYAADWALSLLYPNTGPGIAGPL